MISLTVPASSVETIAPCTAETVPTADNIGAQSSSFTGALVTVATGIGAFVVAILTICIALIPQITRTNAPTAKRALITILPVDFTFASLLKGLATSCIGQLSLRLEQ